MEKLKQRKKKKGISVQAFLAIKEFTEYGLQTANGELLFFRVLPTNISVLSSENIEAKIRQLTLALSAVPDIEIVCTDAAECFDENRVYLAKRLQSERNPKIRTLIESDAEFLDGIQAEMATARQFMFTARCRGMTAAQVFEYSNRVQKVISEQGFDCRLMKKDDIKCMLALYFGASMYGEQMPDYDGMKHLRGAE